MSHPNRTGQPVQPVSVSPRWLRNNLHEPDGQSLVEINGTAYWLTVLRDGDHIVGYRLEKLASGRVAYDVDVTAEPWTCECGDYLHRRAGKDPNGCKHCAGLRQLLAAVGQA
jgi:hypothetical protein